MLVFLARRGWGGREHALHSGPVHAFAKCNPPSMLSIVVPLQVVPSFAMSSCHLLGRPLDLFPPFQDGPNLVQSGNPGEGKRGGLGRSECKRVVISTVVCWNFPDIVLQVHSLNGEVPHAESDSEWTEREVRMAVIDSPQHPQARRLPPLVATSAPPGTSNPPKRSRSSRRERKEQVTELV